jgi:hypothetical protein
MHLPSVSCTADRDTVAFIANTSGTVTRIGEPTNTAKKYTDHNVAQFIYLGTTETNQFHSGRNQAENKHRNKV